MRDERVLYILLLLTGTLPLLIIVIADRNVVHVKSEVFKL
jgi:hypothetical protein